MVPALDHGKTTSLGKMIKDAVTRSRSKTQSNANLGIIIAISPLAAASTSPRQFFEGQPMRIPQSNGVLLKTH